MTFLAVPLLKHILYPFFFVAFFTTNIQHFVPSFHAFLGPLVQKVSSPKLVEATN